MPSRIIREAENLTIEPDGTRDKEDVKDPAWGDVLPV